MLLLMQFNPLKTKRRPLYLKPQSLPRCKHFSSGYMLITNLMHWLLFKYDEMYQLDATIVIYYHK